MKSGLISVSDLFDGTKKFYIPKYQRSYAWEQSHWSDFLEDLITHPKNHKYFYGTILLKDSGKDSDFDVFEVVDGQQRITTLTILIHIIINNLSDFGSTLNLDIKREKYLKYHDVHKLRLGNEGDNEFFQTYVLFEKNIPTTFNTPAQHLLYKSKKFFKSQLDNMKPEILEGIINIVENADILVYSVKESAEASLIFETTNDRGKGLTNLEKIKSFLMYKAYLSMGKEANDIINNIYSRFGDIYKVLERTKKIIDFRDLKDVGEDRICQYHFIGLDTKGDPLWNYKYQYQNYLDLLKSYVNELAQHKTTEEILVFIDNYTISLRDTFNSFENVISLQNKHLNEIIYLERIAVFYPLMLKSYQLDTTKDKKLFSQLLEILSIFSFRIFGMRFKRTGDIDLTINKICRNFKGDFKTMIQDLKQKINEWGPMSDFLARLRLPSFYNESKKTQNFLFWKYENYLRTTFQPICGEMPFEEFNDKSGKFKISIEHITAQTPKNGLQFRNIDDEFRENFLHCLGNLTIDPQSSNSSKGNEIWENKNEKYFQKAPFKTQLELSDFVDNSTKRWDETCIGKRKDKIIDIAKVLWAV